jgi:hypothetical protein
MQRLWHEGSRGQRGRHGGDEDLGRHAPAV